METCKIGFSPTPANYEAGDFKPGVFVVAVCGTVQGSDPTLTKCTEVEVTLIDPCDPPTSFTVDDEDNQAYTIFDTEHPDYTSKVPTIDPSFCKYSHSIVVTKF